MKIKFFTSNFLLLFAMNSAIFAQTSQPPRGWHKFQIGKFEAFVIYDGSLSRPVNETYLKNLLDQPINSETIIRARQTLKKLGLPEDNLHIDCNSLVLKTPQGLILLDAGGGDWGPPAAPPDGKWLENFRAAGLKVEDVKYILISHFHPDHIGGLRNRAGRLTFPNAKVYVPKGETEFWFDKQAVGKTAPFNAAIAKIVEQIFEPLKKDLVLMKEGQEIIPGIRAEKAFGHTPGQFIFEVKSGKDKLIYWADATSNPVFFAREPELFERSVIDPKLALETRLSLMKRLVRQKTMMMATHAPFPAIGYLTEDKGRYSFAPDVR